MLSRDRPAISRIRNHTNKPSRTVITANNQNVPLRLMPPLIMRSSMFETASTLPILTKYQGDSLWRKESRSTRPAKVICKLVGTSNQHISIWCRASRAPQHTHRLCVLSFMF